QNLVGVEKIQSAGIAYRHQRSRLALRHCQYPRIERQKQIGVDGSDLPAAGTGGRGQFDKLQSECLRYQMRTGTQFLACALGGTTRIVSKFHNLTLQQLCCLYSE